MTGYPINNKNQTTNYKQYPISKISKNNTPLKATEHVNRYFLKFVFLLFIWNL